MADPPRYPDTGVGSDPALTTSTPRWVKMVGLAVILLLVVLFVILHLAGGGLQGLHQ